MNCLKRLFQKKQYTLETFAAAGIIFTNGTHVLGGYQPLKKKPFVSGIGGTKQNGETYMDTAIRETLEELFEFEEIPPILASDIQKTIQPKQVLFTHNYVSVVYTFTDLHELLQLLHCYELKSNVYKTLPHNLTELLFQRTIGNNSEISHLCLLPIVDHNLKIDTYFLEDISNLKKTS